MIGHFFFQDTSPDASQKWGPFLRVYDINLETGDDLPFCPDERFEYEVFLLVATFQVSIAAGSIQPPASEVMVSLVPRNQL